MSVEQASPRFFGIARKFIVSIILFSSLLTLIFAGLQLYIDYTRELRAVRQQITTIQASHLPGLINDLWKFDDQGIQSDLQGILNYQVIESLRIERPDAPDIMVGRVKGRHLITHSIPLTFTHQGKALPLGTLHITASTDVIIERLQERGLVIFVTQFMLISFVSAFVFFLFYYLVGRHLQAIAAHTSALTSSNLDSRLRLRRADSTGSQEDELDIVVASINAMQSQLSGYIGELRQAGEELGRAKNNLDAMINALPDLMFRIDREGRIYEFHSSSLDQLYIPPDTFLGKKVAQVLPEEPSRIIMAALGEADEKGSHRGGIYSLTMPRGEMWYELSISAMGEPGAPDTHFIMLARDVTARKIVKEQLRISEENYRNITGLTSDFVHKCTRTGSDPFRIQWAGGRVSAISGYSAEEIYARGCWLPFVHPDDRQAVADHLFSLAPGDRKTIEFRLITKQGATRWISEANSCIAGEKEGELVLFGSSTDITERKQTEEERLRLEQQLLHTQKLESLGVLAGGIAHDFNNILTTIIGNADLALMRLNPESPVQENLQSIEKAAERAADLARQMLAYSGKGKFIVEPIDMNRLVEEMGHMLEVSISKKANLRYNLTHPLPAVDADATQIRQIIMNLVINASEAIGEHNGVIAVSTGTLQCDERYLRGAWLTDRISEGLYVFVEIADTGCGMDADTLGKLFDPFFTTKFTGRGLGMAAVLGIVRGHKGAIKVYSEPRKGTTFKVLFPASGRPTESSDGGIHESDWKGEGKVLLVDDEVAVRGVGSAMLKELGYNPITADDGRQALELFSNTPDIALVILDLTMPHMDGEQCFRELRQLDPQVRVVISSGFSEYEVTQKFVGKGLAGFVQKPYKLSALREVLARIEGEQ